jgi:Bacterial type II and III secretion system protein
VKKIYSILILLVCLTPHAARAQEPSGKIDYPLQLDMMFVEIDSALPDDTAALAQDKERLRSLMSEGKARVISRTQMHTRAGKSVSYRTGMKVPIQVSALPFADRAGQRNVRPDQPFGAFAPVIQYEEVGLFLEAHTVVASGGLVDITLRVEIKDVDRSTGNLTPSFAIRYLNEFARLRLNEQTMLLGASGSRLLPVVETSGAPPMKAPFDFVVLLTVRKVE